MRPDAAFQTGLGKLGKASEDLDSRLPNATRPPRIDGRRETPWLSPDGRTLIFTRWDAEVGWVETVDLYMSVLREGERSEPAPLAELNTDGADFGVAAGPNGRWLTTRMVTNTSASASSQVLARYRR